MKQLILVAGIAALVCLAWQGALSNAEQVLEAVQR